MFEVKKILAAWVLPPGIFVLLALLSGLWMLRRRVRWGVLNLGLAGLIYLLSISPVADRLLGPLEKAWQIPRKVSGDVIVVLGGGVISGVPDLSGQGFPGAASLSRLITGLRLQRATGLPIILSGGKVYKGKDAEAPVTRRILGDLGMAAGPIIIEDQSRDTRGNARFVKKICDQKNWRQIILVTSAYHMARASSAFRKAGLEVHPYPGNFLVAPLRSYAWPDYLPRMRALALSSIAIHEYLGLFFYHLAH
jgi:uncharacterized SAM-binding protein YcdF (DUF218 family)